MDEAFLRGLDSEVQMVPLCGASKARPAVKMALVLVVLGVWGRNSQKFRQFRPIVNFVLSIYYLAFGPLEYSCSCE